MMQVRSISPHRRRYGDEVVAEVDEEINQMPGVEGELPGIPSSGDQAVVAIASLQVVADQQSS